MTALRLRLPISLHHTVRQLAERDDVSINQFITTAVAEKVAALLAVDYLKARAERADRGAIDRVLARVQHATPYGDGWGSWPPVDQPLREPHQRA
ncbi:MAG TPA: toxin-antitoxin system HicB family antitoxin [Gemmatimonadaceae bacterium]|nr:toxin-antitoxin system HicB family antitoxin [Gemmatimonadaceae bacterium]